MPVTESAQGNTAVKSYPFLILALKLIKVMTTNLLFFFLLAIRSCLSLIFCCDFLSEPAEIARNTAERNRKRYVPSAETRGRSNDRTWARAGDRSQVAGPARYETEPERGTWQAKTGTLDHRGRLGSDAPSGLGAIPAIARPDWIWRCVGRGAGDLFCFFFSLVTRLASCCLGPRARWRASGLHALLLLPTCVTPLQPSLLKTIETAQLRPTENSALGRSNLNNPLLIVFSPWFLHAPPQNKSGD
jgi:hypothetical protein